MQRTKNPILNQVSNADVMDRSNSATYLGISIKTGILLLTTIISGLFAWFLISTKPESAVTILSVSGITAFISVLLASFIPRMAMPFSILYTLAEGFILGALTVVAEAFAPGIGMTAVIITVVIFGVMLALYSSRTIRATSKFRKFMFSTIIAILIFSILGALIPQISALFANNFGLAIGLSAFLIIYGAFMLILNFDQAEYVVDAGADKMYEWSVSLGLMITIFWIYIEVIRLLIILAANRD